MSNLYDAYSPIHVLAPLLRAGQITPAELTETYLHRIQNYNPKLHAYIDIYADQARQAAEAATGMIRAGQWLGPLHGIPIALKDLIDWEGRITTGGSPNWQTRRSDSTAAIVQRLLAAGMIVLGKTHTVEFAYGGWGTNEHLGTPWNPWDLQTRRTPGGSSSGSGVATAAGLTAAAIGTDTGGSVRLPAAFCGLVGLKTTVGLISTEGILPLSRTLDTAGPLTRAVEDAAYLFNALRGMPAAGSSQDPLDPLPRLRAGVAGMRLAVLPEQEREQLDSEVLANYDASLKVLEQLGAQLLDIPLPRSFAGYRDAVAVLISTEGYAELQAIIDDDSVSMDRHVRARMRAGARLSARDYILALRDKQAAQQEMARAMDGVDALLTPSTPTAAIPVAEVDEDVTPAYFTRAGNLLDWCGLTVPNGYTATGLPTGLLINARGQAEALALRIGWAYEQATREQQRTPQDL